MLLFSKAKSHTGDFVEITSQMISKKEGNNHVDIYTSQLKYSGGDRLDITVKGQDSVGKHFAPTWEMVKKYQDNSISQELYTNAYIGILSQLLATNPKMWEQIKNTYYQKRITLVCFCPAGAFCHRVILAGALQGMGWGEYKGEI